MRLKSLELSGFKSFAKKTSLEFQSSITSVVGPNGSGKSNVVEAIRFVLGEQSIKSMRGKSGVDLIFKGSKNLSKASRASVTIYFDNSDHIFHLENEGGEKVNLNYDTITISREVFTDGLNKYSLNGTEVRLKDIQALLTSVHIGSSGHHIISQGEADRILNANNRERREMIEDALGLKIYQYKIKESERKLERTTNNMKDVSLLRKEIAPHLNFLRKQVEKLEKAKEQKIELLGLYKEYLQRESVYLEKEKNVLSSERNKISKELEDISSKINDGAQNETKENSKNEDIRNFERKINDIRRVKDELSRKLGRVEGIIEMEEERKNKGDEPTSDAVFISAEKAQTFIHEMDECVSSALSKNDILEIRLVLERIRLIVQDFIPKNKNTQPERPINSIEDLEKTKDEILEQVHKIEDEERSFINEANNLRREIEQESLAGREQEKEKFALVVKRQEFNSDLNMISLREENLARTQTSFEDEIREGSIFLGADILSYKNFEINGEESRENQEERRKKIERIKIKLEDAGLGGGAELQKEFEEVRDRDAFLTKEMIDLETSIQSLRKLMLDLKEKIDLEFKEGVRKINKEFQEFFSLMFGGGSAFLSVVAEQKRKRKGGEEDLEGEDDIEEDGIVFEHGIEISVSLPHKKVKELHALSGGERSLTSIALLFAMSQVNPPPFLVLDETDAALDESNSRKYGDMLEKLSHHSQLIVVTHNRETMSRAGVLYGVTVGSDGGSKLLSVKFEEAAQIAK
ncbi:MAG: AAA family ATPase [Candidatus Nomurabacteria bacterium]|nr:AAA family ATPase [Candidatus Nomurabacteria bacterium]